MPRGIGPLRGLARHQTRGRAFLLRERENFIMALRRKYNYASPSLEFTRTWGFDPLKGGAPDGGVTLDHVLHAILISADAVFDEVRGLRKDMAGEPSQAEEQHPEDADQNGPA